MEHAEQRFVERGHNADDVMYALMYGQVTRVDVQEDIVFRVKGKNIAESRLRSRRP
jgi:hypothetical protein